MSIFNNILTTMASLAGAAALATSASAQDYPERPVSLVVPFPAGGSTDTVGRAAGEALARILGGDVAVTNVGGGAGTVGTAQIARARPDGYTVGVIPAAPLINQPHMRETPYNLDSFDYICGLFYSPQALALSPESEFSSLKEVIDYARENPGDLTYGTPGPGSLPHLAMERFLEETGVEIEHVPFQGDGPAVNALMGGHIDMFMAIFSNVGRYELDAVAVFSDERLDSAPDVPTSVEEGFETTAAWWGGLMGPAGLPQEVHDKLVQACEDVSKDEEFVETMGKLGTFPRFMDDEAVRAEVEEGSATNKPILDRVLN